MAFEVTKQEILKQAIALNKLWKQTREQKYKDEEVRLRRIVFDLENFGTSGSGGVNKIVAGNNISINPSSGTGDVTINATLVAPDPTGYGAFYSNQDQSLAAVNTSQIVTLNNTYEANAVSISNNKIVFDKAGTYQFTYVAQVFNIANSIEHCEFWIEYNGTAYPVSASHVTLQPRKSSTEPSEHQMKLTLTGTAQNDGDYIELYWQGSSTDLYLGYVPASSTEPVAAPSIIANIIPVGAQGRDSNLSELNDVYITNPSDKDVLSYDATNQRWEAVSLSAVMTTYTHIQSSAVSTWSINHNLGRYPSVSVVDSAGNKVIGDVEYVDSDNIDITFCASFSGKAYLN